jgi:type IV secretory pathway VirB10-like protein
MKRLMIVMVSSFGVVGGAHAQAQTSFGPDNGFFRPAPDVALTTSKATASTQPAAQPFLTLQSQSLPPVAPPVPALVAPVVNAPAIANPAAQQQPASPAAAQAWAERQMDRSVAEADRQRAQMQAAPAGVGAAFDGTTSSENR